MRCWPVSLLVLGCLAVPVFALAQNGNAGIVQGLWFSQEQIVAGETVRIYAAIRNNTGADLSGTVEFFADNERIGRKNIAALNGRIIESWADWTPAYGTSTIRATLSRTEISSTASGTTAIAVTSALAETELFVDRDTDGDRRGDRTDRDDDGDGILDEADERPLEFDAPAEADEAAEATADERDTAARADGEPERSPSAPAGLEQFLAPNRADTVLANLTNTINTAKQKLDDYRSERQADRAAEDESVAAPSAPVGSSTATTTAAAPTVATNADGFGTIERSKSAAAGPGWWAAAGETVRAIASAGYTSLLAALSFALGYPALLQLLLLFLILFIIVKVAHRLARRPI